MFWFVLRQGLTAWLRLVLNLWPFCPRLFAGITDGYHHVQL